MKASTTKSLPTLFKLVLILCLELKLANAAGGSPSSTSYAALNTYSWCIGTSSSHTMESWTNGNPVTSIEIYTIDSTYTQIFSFQVNSQGDKTPDRGCSPALYQTLNLAASTKITMIETWYNSDDLCQIIFTVSNSSTFTYTSSAKTLSSCTKT